MAVISFLLLFEYKGNIKNDKENNVQKNGSEKYENSKDKNIVLLEILNDKEKEEEEEGISVKEAFIQATKGVQIYQLWVMSTILQIVSFTITNTYRSFAQQCLMEEIFK